MPEISFCLFDLKYLFKLFPKEIFEFRDNMHNFETKLEEEMAANREKLFEQYAYDGEFENV